MKLNKFTLTLLAAALFLGISCKDEEKQEATPAEVETSEAETTEGSTTTASLNPEHGAPGHRCDIPVGAPLSSAGNSNTSQSTTPASTTVSPVWTEQAAPNKNPPHGQPGHRCDIPVGADLNS